MVREIDKQIDRALSERTELVEQNQSFQEMTKTLDGYASIDQKIKQTEWLNDSELDLLELDKDVLKDYKEAREIMLAHKNKTDEERVLQYLQEQNEEIEAQNQKVEEMYKEKLAVKRLDEVLETLDQQIERLFKTGIGPGDVKSFLEHIKGLDALSKKFRPIGVSSDYTALDFSRKREIYRVTKELKKDILKSSLTPDDILLGSESLQERIIELADAAVKKFEDFELKKKVAQERLERNDDGALAKIRKYFSK